MASVTHMFPGFLTPVLTLLFLPKPPTTFLTCFCRGERRKYAGKKSPLNRKSNSEPPCHESDTLTTEPPGWGHNFVIELSYITCVFLVVRPSLVCQGHLSRSKLNTMSHFKRNGHYRDINVSEIQLVPFSSANAFNSGTCKIWSHGRRKITSFKSQ